MMSLTMNLISEIHYLCEMMEYVLNNHMMITPILEAL